MDAAFGTVLWVVVALAVVVGVATLLGSAKLWEEYAENLLVMDQEQARAPTAGSPAALRERDAEILQMLEARNARRLRRGEPPLELDAEIARLAAPQVDAELRSEIRDMVLARNLRRARAGKPPLDVDAEIGREIAGLSGLGLL